MNDFAADLFKRYYKGLCYFAWKLVGDSELAEDLAQDAFIAYLQRKENVSEDENSIRSFLYTAVKFAAFNINRKNKVVAKYWTKVDFREMDEIDLEHTVIQSEFYSRVYQIIATLPPSCQEICKMGYIEGYSNEEISEILKLSVNTVKTQKRRGIAVLKSIMKPELMAFFLAFTDG